jgi:hypothetical protein
VSREKKSDWWWFGGVGHEWMKMDNNNDQWTSFGTY